MLLYLVFLGGVVLGTVFTRFYLHYGSVGGYFSIAPYQDETGVIEDDFFLVSVSLKKDEKLLKKKWIILTKVASQN